MKIKLSAVFLGFLLFPAFFSCVSKSARIPNPIVEVDSAGDFTSLGFIPDAPANAQHIQYSIIAKKTAQVDFMVSGAEYCLRAAKNTEWKTLSGIYEEFSEEPVTRKISFNGKETTVSLHIAANGAKVAEWADGRLTLTLYSPEPVNAETFFILASQIPLKW